MRQKTLDNGMVVSHSYDAAGRETVLANLKQDGSALALFTATYDPAGNRLDVQETVNGASAHVSYLYDDDDQLTREWSDLLRDRAA